MKKLISIGRATELELWLINNYQIFLENDFENKLISMGFDNSEVEYLKSAYLMPLPEIKEMIDYYDKNEFFIDELKFVNDLEKRYKVSRKEVIRRIRYVREIVQNSILPEAIIYNKLVRDKIPEIIENNGDTPICDVLSREEYYEYLLKKDSEELEEVKSARTKDQVKEELGDKLEVLIAMANYHGFTLDDIIEVASEKRDKKGGFDSHIILKRTYKGRYHDKS